MKISTIKELKKISWLIDVRDGIVKPVLSATKIKVRIGESNIPSVSFFDSHIKNYEIPSEPKLKEVMTERVTFFLMNHSGEIKGLFNDKYYKNGGWNGMMDAISEVEKKYPSEINMIDYDYVDLEKIVNEIL